MILFLHCTFICRSSPIFIVVAPIVITTPESTKASRPNFIKVSSIKDYREVAHLEGIASRHKGHKRGQETSTAAPYAGYIEHCMHVYVILE